MSKAGAKRAWFLASYFREIPGNTAVEILDSSGGLSELELDLHSQRRAVKLAFFGDRREDQPLHVR